MVGFCRRVGLGLLVGAVLQSNIEAQTPTPRDTTRRDTVTVPVPPRPDSLPTDSLRADSVAARERRLETERLSSDTIKDPLARGEIPVAVEIGGAYRWNRDALFASGAVNLLDLLERVPGVTSFRSGWVVSPQTASYLGDFETVRVFLDGVELDPLDPQMGPMHDLSRIQLFSLEEVMIERAAREIRVHLRSWRVVRTSAATRVDVSTGDLETNTYRGYFGRRLGNGGAVQIAAQQFSTTDRRNGGDGDQLSFFGRAGWARGKWTIDIVGNRVGRSRSETLRQGPGPRIPALDGTWTDAYARAAYGDPDEGSWFQLIAATSRFSEEVEVDDGTSAASASRSVPTDLLASVAVVDTVDSTTSSTQYVATGGVTRWGASLSAAARMRSLGGERYLSPSARLGFDRRFLALAGYAESSAEDSMLRADVSVRLTPFGWFSLGGALGRSQGRNDGNARPTTTVMRAEAGLRLRRTWATAGIFRRDTAVIAPPIIYDSALVPIASNQVTGAFANIRGFVWRAVGVDVTAMRWNQPGSYRPQYQTRTEVYARTNWLTRFPAGNFGVNASVIHEYRTAVSFPVAQPPALSSTQYRSISTLLELRLYDAVLSWQFRNILGAIYQTVPGFEMPRAINFYGVRWDFFN